MAWDEKKNFHMSGLRPTGKEGKLPMSGAPQRTGMTETAGAGKNVSSGAEGGEDVHEVVDHHDGSFTTRHPEHGEVHHETMGHMHAHLSAKHGQEGEKHFHAHNDGYEAHSHSAETSQEPEHRDHAPEDTQGMQDHLSEAMGEGPSGGSADGETSFEHEPQEGLSGFQG
jgi:hypothetical protein